MKYHYIVIESSGEIMDSCFISYGIALVSVDDLTTVLQTVTDLSLDKEKVRSLVEKCNELQLDPIQLEDVAEDFVAEN